jgi:hypothetical protein
MGSSSSQVSSGTGGGASVCVPPGGPGWEAYAWNGTCYLLRKVSTDWDTGGASCASIGAELAVLGTLAKLEGVAAVLPPSPIYVWVGADDKALEADWNWRDGNDLPANSLLWGPSQPNDMNDEDCAALVLSVQPYRLYDLDCVMPADPKPYTLCELVP